MRPKRRGASASPVRHILGSGSDVEAAYAVQRVNNDLAVAAGRRVSGHKIGLTSPVVQEQVGITHPVSGTLFADRCVADGIDLPAGRLVQPKAEGEIAFVLGGDLDRGEHCVTDVISATAYLLPAIEIVDSRTADWDVTATDMIADNVCSGFYVVGSRPNPSAAATSGTRGCRWFSTARWRRRVGDRRASATRCTPWYGSPTPCASAARRCEPATVS